jgi:hypothetical protein
MGKKNHKTLAITYGTGFQMTFPNGVTASIQFGPYNYITDRDKPVNLSKNTVLVTESDDAEVAALLDTHDDKKCQWATYAVAAKAGLVPNEHDDVMGWVKTVDVEKFIHAAATITREEIAYSDALRKKDLDNDEEAC